MNEHLKKLLDKKIVRLIVIYQEEGDESIEADAHGYPNIANVVADLEATKFTMQYQAMKKTEEAIDVFIEKFDG